MRDSERDRGLFIQYLARKYAERALNQRSAPCVSRLAQLLQVTRQLHFFRCLFLISVQFLFSILKPRKKRAKSASQVHADVLLRNLSLIP